MRQTVFLKVDYDLKGLVSFIEQGYIGLPDIQRPFIWKNAKVRDLFDSMYKGYPVGYLLFWQNAYSDDSKVIGTRQKQLIPKLLIVDGQQRLTSIYAVVMGVPVIRDNYDSESIEIAFNPLQEKFEVSDAAIRRDKTFLPNISVLWQDDTDLFEVVDNYLANLRSSREVSTDEEKQIKKAISRLNSLLTFPFTALELASDIGEEQVAEVFVRINSKGIPLNQADFILTLMSVFWDEGRAELERFCRDARQPIMDSASPFNYFIHPDPDQLLRVSIGIGFKRARLKYVYSILRGKDLETEQFSQELRDQQFEVLKQSQKRVLNLQYWHDFMKAIRQAGFLGMHMFGSKNNLLFSYIIYLIGRTEYRVNEFLLRRVVARWFFMSNVTGRYSSSPEGAMEFDLARLRDFTDADTFVNTLDRVCDQTLTDDFWNITLPNQMATSSPQSPALFAYYAALVLFDARVLFSKQKVSDLLDPSTHAKRAAAERHHLFPKNYLKSKLGIDNIRQTNQVANYALMEWGDNTNIADHPPTEYVPVLKQRFSPMELTQMCYWHALPDNWEEMEYEEFLVHRREMIAKVISEAYQRLSPIGKAETFEPATIEELVVDGETTEVEFKSTLRVNLHTDEKDHRMELAVLRTIAGFLNTKGGTLVVGIADDGSPIGIEADKFENEDKMNLHLANLLNSRIGPQYMMYIHPRFEDYDGGRIMAVECWASKSPVFVKDGNTERFYIRTGTSSTELTGSQTQDFIKQRFG